MGSVWSDLLNASAKLISTPQPPAHTHGSQIWPRGISFLQGWKHVEQLLFSLRVERPGVVAGGQSCRPAAVIEFLSLKVFQNTQHITAEEDQLRFAFARGVTRSHAKRSVMTCKGEIRIECITAMFTLRLHYPHNIYPTYSPKILPDIPTQHTPA